MDTQDFEELISEDGKADSSGFVYKANEEFRIREFLNDTVYTDSMLNHIIVNAGSVQQWRVFI